MQSNSSNGQLTAQISMSDHKKSGFDLSNNVLGTGKIGRIIPTRALHVMPGDTIKQDSKVAVQFEPLAVPILANMDVRQEHFYVPYNIVWRNWDNFISGGEKLDYKGVVPNVTMKDIVQCVIAEFDNPNSNFSSPSLDVITSAGNTRGFVDFQALAVTVDNGRFDTLYKTGIDYVGNKYEIKDLLGPMYEVIGLMKDYIKRMNTTNGQYTQFFVGISSPIVYNAAIVHDNKYIREIAPALDKIMTDYGFSLYYIPTAEAIEYMQLLYEYYKPFFGIGSNIDYLNMSRVTFTDFLYALLTNFNLRYLSAIDANSTTPVKLELYSAPFSNLPMSVLNLRANYNIWYNNYRDILLEANAQEPVDIDTVSATELFTLLVPRQRCWEKDAFTTALDNPATGNVGVPVGLQNSGLVGDYTSFVQDIKIANEPQPNADANNTYKVTIDGREWFIPTAYLTGVNTQDSSNPLTSGGFSLYQLDAAQRAQKWLQKALFYGNRISDFYYMHFGVRFLDARLRLPELLTSSKELVKLDVVMNNTNITTEANGEVFQSIAGDRAAYASAYDNGNSFDRFCEEHGVIMSFLTIMPQVTYAYGMNRDYSRLDQFDFAFSEFATLGMDAVYDSEITMSPVLDNSEIRVFGYQGKYYDYKAKHSEEHGELLDSQDMYTFARKFNMYDPNGRPKLNYEFVHCFPSLDMFVVDSQLADYFRYDIRHSTAAERNLPSQSIYI